ncbi:MAG TPA: tol-pal system protein YbgF [Methylococcaceae bacterium]|nr:tol-pal system protein YbgF [Methylococcaceae bacterium]
MSGSVFRKLLLGGLAFLPAFPLLGADESYATIANLIERVERLEKRFSGTAMMELSSQNEHLRGEVQSLRGEVEELNHRLETLAKQQHDMYLDLEGRLKPGAPAGAGETSAGGADAAEEADNAGEAAEAPKPPASKASAEEIRAAYQKAFDALKETRYKESIVLFNQFLAAYPGREYADNAQYWLGEAYHVTKDFPAAREAFRKLIDAYPQSAKLPDAWLKLGLIDYDMQQWASARKVFGEVKTRFPNSKAASAAESRLQKMKQEGH